MCCIGIFYWILNEIELTFFLSWIWIIYMRDETVDSVGSTLVIFFFNIFHATLKFHQQLNSFSIKSSISKPNTWPHLSVIQLENNCVIKIKFLKESEWEKEGMRDRLEKKVNTSQYLSILLFGDLARDVNFMTHDFVYFCPFFFSSICKNKTKKLNSVTEKCRWVCMVRN